MLQVLSPEELSLPFEQHVELQDLETGNVRLVDTTTATPLYRSAITAFLDRCRTSALRDGADYGLLTTNTPPEIALRAYLLQRENRPPLRSCARVTAR
jgi:hypothetical protein